MVDSPDDEVKSRNIFLLATTLSLIEIALLSAGCFVVAVTSIDRNFVVFLAFALGAGLLGLLGSKNVERDRDFNAGEIFQIIALNFCIMIFLCSFIYLSLGLCGTFDKALFESVSGLTTTSLTNLLPESLGRSVLIFRSATQWVGGLGALVLVFVALPAAGRSEEFDVAFAKSFTKESTQKTLRRIGKFYTALTTVVGIAFFVAGMGFFDSLCHAFTTISTGGFSTRNASIAGFESAAIEWVVAAAMIFSGINIVVLWWIWKRKFESIVKNSEFRFYLLLIVVSLISFGIWIRDYGSFGSVTKDSLFLIASLLSTTGFSTVSWEFPSAMSGIVLLLLGIGAMAGSAGGGYGSGRLLQHYRFARRELTQQYKPKSVRVVKVSGQVIDERALQRLHGFTAIFIALVAVGALTIALANPEKTPIQALSISLTALVTAGPFMGSSAETTDLNFDATTHVAVSMLMLIGRLSIFPIAYLGVALLRTFREGPIRRVGQMVQGR